MWHVVSKCKKNADDQQEYGVDDIKPELQS